MRAQSRLIVLLALSTAAATAAAGVAANAGAAPPVPLGVGSSVAMAKGAWVSTGSLLLGRREPAMARTRGGRVLVAGGVDPEGGCTSAAEIYHPRTGTWTETTPLHTARTGAMAIRLRGGRVMVAGGVDCVSKVLRSVEIYHPATKRWVRAAAMNKRRSEATLLTLHGGRVMALGGSRAVEIYRPGADRWKLTSPLPEVRSAYMGVLGTRLQNGDVLVAGGYNSHAGPLASAVRYDHKTKVWYPAGRLSERRATSLFTLPNGRVLAIGGFPGARASDRVDMYLPKQNRWRRARPLPHARAFFGLSSVDGQPLVIGGLGRDDAVRAGAYLYLPGAHRWATKSPMPHPRYRFGVVPLRDGSTLVAGGTTQGPGGPWPSPALASAVRFVPGR